MSKQTIKHEAFLDLEQGMAGQLLPVWEEHWNVRGEAIALAAEEGRWADAHQHVETVDMRTPLEKRAKTLDTIGMAALLLGASRLGRIDRTVVYKEPPKEVLAAAVAQVHMMVGDNATQALRQELHLSLDKFEYALSSSNEAGIEDVAKAVKGKNKYVPQSVRAQQVLRSALTGTGANRGAQFIGLAANLHISRLSSAGFLLQANSQQMTEYQISEVMDRRTCPVCAKMHGLTFRVADGLQQMSRILSANSAASLRLTAPWPSRTKAGIEAFSKLDHAGLVDAGYNVPPYHPGCRGILVPVGTVPVIDIVADLSADFADVPAPDALTQRLFGDRSDLTTTAGILFSSGAVSALYNLTPAASNEEELDAEREENQRLLLEDLGL